MDPAKFREALGLDDASDDEVMTALAEAGFIPQSEPPSDGGVPAPVAASTADAVLLDPAQYSALRVQAQKGEEAWRLLRESECEQILASAVKAGKFPPSRRDHWKQLWASDPDGTRATIDKLATNVIPIAASGYPGVGDETEIDMVYASMYPDTKVGGSRG